MARKGTKSSRNAAYRKTAEAKRAAMMRDEELEVLMAEQRYLNFKLRRCGIIILV